MNLVDYINGLVNASLGRGAEGFTDASSTSPVPILSSVKNLYTSIPILLIVHLTAMMVYGLGAARLSYCYQMATNPSATFFYVYILLAFMFSPVYYPYYGIVLNPLCLKK